MKFALELVIMFSLGGVFYLLVRALPRISNEEIEVRMIRTHWLQSYIERFDGWFKVLGEKLLRRLQIILLRLDNKVRQKLEKFKKDSSREARFPSDEEKS